MNNLSQGFGKSFDAATKGAEKTAGTVTGLKDGYDALGKTVSKTGNMLASVFAKQEQACKKASESMKDVVKGWKDYDDAVAKARSSQDSVMSSGKTGGFLSSVAGIFSWDKIRS